LLADVVYDDHLIAPLLTTVRHLSDGATCILLAYDVAIHRHTVYAAFERACAEDFEWHELETTAPPPVGRAGCPDRRGEPELPWSSKRVLKESVRLVRLVRHTAG